MIIFIKHYYDNHHYQNKLGKRVLLIKNEKIIET